MFVQSLVFYMWFYFSFHMFLFASEAMFRIVVFPTEGKIYLPSELTCYTNSECNITNRCSGKRTCVEDLPSTADSWKSGEAAQASTWMSNNWHTKPKARAVYNPVSHANEAKWRQCLPSFLPLSQCNKTQQCYFRMLWYTSRSFLCFHIYNHFSPLNS